LSGYERSPAGHAHPCSLDRFLAWRYDIGAVSDINPPWIITIGSSFIGFFAGAYADDLAPRKK
jgi:hypothetical protein